jgi:hypothetical protein
MERKQRARHSSDILQYTNGARSANSNPSAANAFAKTQPQSTEKNREQRSIRIGPQYSSVASPRRSGINGIIYRETVEVFFSLGKMPYGIRRLHHQ